MQRARLFCEYTNNKQIRILMKTNDEDAKKRNVGNIIIRLF